jgi:hypothetical protein
MDAQKICPRVRAQVSARFRAPCPRLLRFAEIETDFAKFRLEIAKFRRAPLEITKTPPPCGRTRKDGSTDGLTAGRKRA